MARLALLARPARPALLLLGSLALASACDSGSPGDAAEDEMMVDPPADGLDGEAVYRQPVDDGNTFTCSTCHALSEPASDGIRRVGHPLGDAAARPSYKNGTLFELRDAVNSCLQEWMNAEPWSADDERWLALEGFLQEQAPAQAEALRFEVVQPPADADLAGGDAAAGQALFDSSCSACHGLGGTGTQLAPPVAGFGLEPGYVARRVRTSGRSDSDVYEGLTGGIMPFWAADRLSDDELRDLVAWLAVEQDPPEEPTDPPDPTDPDPPDDPPSGCTQTHPLVGATAILEENFHDVGGIAEILDDCTIEIREFTFDGTGVEVRLYGGLGGNYDAGFAIGDNLLKPGGYSGETLRFTLPEGRTFDDLDGVSVWCVPVGVDFGSGMFGQ